MDVQVEPRTRTADDIFAVLRLVHAVLDRSGIWHCLLYGTLLGAIRDGDIIPWDHDIDLLVRPVDVPAILALNGQARDDGLVFRHDRVSAAQLAVNPAGVPWVDPGRLGIELAGESYGELYAPSLFRDGVLRCHDFEHEAIIWPRTAFPAYAVETLATATIRGHAFPVPGRSELLLGWLYGEDWRTPYRCERDGGAARSGHTAHGDLPGPRLADQLAWCDAQGWDRSAFAAQPEWPRALRAAGPGDAQPRTIHTSKSEWWHDLAEISDQY